MYYIVLLFVGIHPDPRLPQVAEQFHFPSWTVMNEQMGRWEAHNQWLFQLSEVRPDLGIKIKLWMQECTEAVEYWETLLGVRWLNGGLDQQLHHLEKMRRKFPYYWYNGRYPPLLPAIDYPPPPRCQPGPDIQ